ncbi:hypothetical protein ACJX0J_028263, partial [Zea mays]
CHYLRFRIVIVITAFFFASGYYFPLEMIWTRAKINYLIYMMGAGDQRHEDAQQHLGGIWEDLTGILQQAQNSSPSPRYTGSIDKLLWQGMTNPSSHNIIVYVLNKMDCQAQRINIYAAKKTTNATYIEIKARHCHLIACHGTGKQEKLTVIYVFLSACANCQPFMYEFQ